MYFLLGFYSMASFFMDVQVFETGIEHDECCMWLGYDNEGTLGEVLAKPVVPVKGPGH